MENLKIAGSRLISKRFRLIGSVETLAEGFNFNCRTKICFPQKFFVSAPWP